MKASDVQWEKASSIFEQDSPSSHSPIFPNDYVHLREAVFETIQVFQKTKNGFRSKDLVDLRKKLESVLAHINDSLKNPTSPTD